MRIHNQRQQLASNLGIDYFATRGMVNGRGDVVEREGKAAPVVTEKKGKGDGDVAASVVVVVRSAMVDVVWMIMVEAR